jgi:hypothetical protein
VPGRHLPSFHKEGRPCLSLGPHGAQRERGGEMSEGRALFEGRSERREGGEEEEEEEEKRVSIESKVRPACTLISKLGFSLAK